MIRFIFEIRDAAPELSQRGVSFSTENVILTDKDSKDEFTVHDRRHFDRDGNAVSEEEPQGAAEPRDEEAPSSSFPPEAVDFTSILFSYFHTALIYLGDVEDPIDGKKKENLPGTKQMIDILEMFQNKTKGNLTTEEAEFLERALFDLRMRYLQKAKLIK